MNVAVTDVASFIVTTHTPVPAHAPPQPVKVELPEGVALRVTTVPPSYAAEQVDPQLIPDGELVTVPVPVPDSVTVSVGSLPPAVLYPTVPALVESHPPVKPVKG